MKIRLKICNSADQCRRDFSKAAVGTALTFSFQALGTEALVSSNYVETPDGICDALFVHPEGAPILRF